LLSKIRPLIPVTSHVARLSGVASNMQFSKRPYLNIEDFSFNEDTRIFTTWNRHNLWLADHSNGKKFVLKEMNGDAIWRQARESGASMNSFGSPEEEDKFRAETEAFLSAFMRKLAPEHSPKSVEVVFGVDDEGQKKYYVASEFQENYLDFNSLDIKDKKRFFVGEKGETRLLLSTDPDKSIAIYGRIATKLALNATREWDDNPENIGVICNPAEVSNENNPDKRYPVFSIDHEISEDLIKRPKTSHEIFGMAKKVASGKGFSVYSFMDLNHLQIAAREDVRMESVKHTSNVFREQYLSPDIFMERLSRDYSPEYQQKIYNIGINLQERGAVFAAANTLIQNNWDGSEEHSHKIFQDKYGGKYLRLSHYNIWNIESGKQTAISGRA